MQHAKIISTRTNYVPGIHVRTQHSVHISYVPTSRAMFHCCCSFAFESFYFLASWRICRKHVKFTVSWPSLVSYQCLHAYACVRCYVLPYSLPPAPVRQLYVAQLRYLLAPCACAAAVRSSIAIFTAACCRSERLFFLINTAFFFIAQNIFFNIMVRRFSESRNFSIVSRVFCCQSCLSKYLP